MWETASRVARLGLLAIVAIAALGLSGCVQYDVNINFASQNHGEVVQHIRLDKQFVSLNESVVQDWLKSLERRTRELGGRTKQPSQREIIVTIPFNNGAELESKFNQFFQPPSQNQAESLRLAQLEIPELHPQLHITQTNYGLVEQNRLTFDLDLRPLGLPSSNGNLVINPGSLLNLGFRLITPWGAENLGIPVSQATEDGKDLTWMLQTGDISHLEVVFWVPSPLGIGAVAIALIVALGTFLKSRL